MKLKYLLISAVLICGFGLSIVPVEAQTFEPPDIMIRIPGMTDLTSVQRGECPPGISEANYNGCYSFPWIGQYINNLYRFAVMAAVILAAVVLMVAGFLWLTAGGNSSQVSTAKEYISGAILGLSLMLGSYTVLYLVNPNLVVFRSLSIPIIKHIDLKEYVTALVTSGATISECSATTLSGSTGTMPDSAFESYFNSAGQEFGVNPVFLAALAQQESTMGRNLGPSSAGAFGIMQIMPGTADDIWNNNRGLPRPAECSGANDPGSVGYTQTCMNWLRNNPRENIRMGAAYIATVQNHVNSCANVAGFDARSELVAAGYNAGPYRRSICNGDVPPFAETVDYVKKVGGYLNDYCQKSGGTEVNPAPSSP
jgi:hypothetical protein